MIDFDGLKNRIKIFDLVGGGLKKVANTGGGEWAGPCPICGGNDRFRVQPEANIWLCRHCTNGAWRDVVDFIAKRDGVSIADAAAKIVSQGLPVSPVSPGKPKTNRRPYQAYRPPNDEWQAAAFQAVERCQEILHSPTGASALKYLKKRGLNDASIDHFKIGFSNGLKVGDLWIPYGITIPCQANGKLWYLKIRTNTDPKYKLVTGSKPAAIFNADEVAKAKIALMVEGEFNAAIARQATQDLAKTIPMEMAIGSMGAAGNRPDLATWGVYFVNKSLILALFDDDDAGEKGAAAMCISLGERCKLTALPKGSGDLNDFFLAGGDIAEWMKNNIEFWRE